MLIVLYGKVTQLQHKFSPMSNTLVSVSESILLLINTKIQSCVVKNSVCLHV